MISNVSSSLKERIDDEYKRNNRWICACDDVVDGYFLSKMRIVQVDATNADGIHRDEEAVDTIINVTECI